MFCGHWKGDSPETMLVAWREAVPELGAEKKALHLLTITFCINFYWGKKRHKENGKIKIAESVYSAK